MITKWKVAALAVLAAVSVASPALAQSAFTTGSAADSVNAGYPSPDRGPHAYAPNSVSRGSGGFGSFAMVPGTIGGRYSPSANGGGNPGYNWALENDY